MGTGCDALGSPWRQKPSVSYMYVSILMTTRSRSAFSEVYMKLHYYNRFFLF